MDDREMLLIDLLSRGYDTTCPGCGASIKEISSDNWEAFDFSTGEILFACGGKAQYSQEAKHDPNTLSRTSRYRHVPELYDLMHRRFFTCPKETA